MSTENNLDKMNVENKDLKEDLRSCAINESYHHLKLCKENSLQCFHHKSLIKQGNILKVKCTCKRIRTSNITTNARQLEIKKKV